MSVLMDKIENLNPVTSINYWSVEVILNIEVKLRLQFSPKTVVASDTTQTVQIIWMLLFLAKRGSFVTVSETK